MTVSVPNPDTLEVPVIGCDGSECVRNPLRTSWAYERDIFQLCRLREVDEKVWQWK